MNNIRLDCEAFRRINPKDISQTTIFTDVGRANRAAVKKHIKENPGLNNKEISQALDSERSVITDITQKLVEQKIIKRGPKVLCDGYKVNTFFIVEQ